MVPSEYDETILKTEIELDLVEALKTFKKELMSDFAKNSSERAKVFRVAYYLQKIMDTKTIYSKYQLVVDCEYNRIKKTSIKNLPELKDETHNGNIIPDLIVHLRNYPDCNLLVCEFKNYNRNNRDKDKLRGLVANPNFKYHLAFFISFKKLRESGDNEIKNVLEPIEECDLK